MNAPERLAGRAAATAVLPPQPYVAGMPQLGHAGLSEHWLLKECGHRHWQGIAALHGTGDPEFRDAAGRKAYAAFTLVRLRQARLDAFGEHARFAIGSEALALGRAQHYGRHTLLAADGSAAEIEMLSAFVRRERAGDNRSVVRAAVADAASPLPDPARHGRAQGFADRARDWRRGAFPHALAAGGGQAAPLQRFPFLPCPNTDFNGAEFLYFASFQALVDRAEWAWLGNSDRLSTVERELAFHGNVNIGEPVEVRLRALDVGGDRIAHWCQVCRAADGQRLADVCTVKRRLAPAARP